MQTCRFGELELSRLMLGTVQFGLNYGVANQSGQPSYAEARAIVGCAYENGVNCFDTAPGYGTSEEVLGRALAELGIAGKMVVVSKIRHMADHVSSTRAADDFVEESVVRSLRRLRLEYLPICLFHAESNFRYIESLLKLRDKGLVRHVGSSVVSPEATAEIIASGLAEAIQLPTNLLDRRFSRSGLLQQMREEGIAAFVRSVYLQGLLLLPETQIPSDLTAVVPVLRQLRELANRAGLSMSEAAMRYVLALHGPTCIVVGVESVQQMEQNIALFAKGPLDADLCAAMGALVPDLPDKILCPNLWDKRMPDAVPVQR